MSDDSMAEILAENEKLVRENRKLKNELKIATEGERMQIIVYDLWQNVIYRFSSLKLAAQKTRVSEKRILACIETGQRWRGKRYALEKKN